MNEDEAFIRAIVDSPGDDTPRLVYADWLDERDDPRGPYLRAEHECARTGKKVKALRALGAALDAVWVYRVSRPPLGVCLRNTPFDEDSCGPQLTRAEVERVGQEYGGFPTAYIAFLLNYNGGCCAGDVEVNGVVIAEFVSINGEHGNSIKYVVDHLADASGPYGKFDLPNDRFPIAFTHGYANDYYCHALMIVREKVARRGITYPLYNYDNPYANEVDDDDLADALDEDCYSYVASDFLAFIQEMDNSLNDS